LALAVSMHDVARREGLDLMHVHYAIPHATSAWIAREMLEGERDLPVVTTLHGTDITLTGLHPSFHAITRFSILRSQGITAVSRYLKEETVRDFGVPDEEIEVIPNFIDTDIWHPDKEPCHRSALAPGGEKIVMHVSNFRGVKRVEDVIEIFSRIAPRVSSRLVMVGDGPERPLAAERAEILGLRDRVLFLGKHASVDELLSCADLFLLPSENESFGLAALEAMACGAPVVASEVGGLPEVVAHGETGFLFPMGEVDDMAAAAIEILKDDALHDRLREAGRSVARLRFSSASVVPRYEAYYQAVLAGRTAGAQEPSTR
jgi:N-acetyl-alpha-D-glucosaminyl L-malate synthase BshA